MELYFLFLLFVLMMAALGAGFPVAFALPGSAILSIGLAALFGWALFDDVKIFFSQDGPTEWLSAGVMNFRAIFYDFERDTLIAIPLFIFMGIMLQRSRIAEDLLMTMAGLFGPVPGGLGISVVFVGALLAATTGIVGATVVAMGLISLPSMMRNNYSPSLATGTICASGTLGQIIPPSIVLIILADQLGSASDQASAMRQSAYKTATGEFTMPSAFDVTSTSAGDMFLGAFLPGMVLVGVYFAYILATALLRPSMAPAVPNPSGFTREFLIKVLVSLVPPLVLIFLVLGSIIMGIATVNQAGAIGAIGATIMAGYKLYEDKKGALHPAILAALSLAAIFTLLAFFDLNIKNVAVTGNHIPVTLGIIASATLILAIAWSCWRAFKVENTLNEVMIETAKTTSMVFIILLGAAMLTSAFRGFGGEHYVKEFLQSLPGGFWTQFVVVMAVIFILGFFLDFIEIAVVVVPIVAPILLADPSANVTAVWLGVMIGLNIQTSFLTPPFGFALFYLRGVASKAVKTLDMYKGVIPFIVLQIAGLAIVGFNPSLVNYLPTRTFLSSETAPPPKNPRLQLCLEDYLFDFYDNNQTAYMAQLDQLKAADLSALPQKRQSAMAKNITNAASIFDRVAEIENAKVAMDQAAVAYAPIHAEVRAIERIIRQDEAEIKNLNRAVRGTDDAGKQASIKDRIAELENEIAEKRGLIPADWQDTNKEFKKLTAQLNRARMQFRRQSDQAYADIRLVVAAIDAKADLAAIGDQLQKIKSDVATSPIEEILDRVKENYSALNQIPEARDAAKTLSDARRAIDSKSPDLEKAMKLIDETRANIASEVAWRAAASASLRAELASFESFARYNLGLREQDRLTSDQVEVIIPCLAQHQNISLQF